MRLPPKTTRCLGLSLCETVISLALTSVSVAAIIDGYVFCAKQAETSALHFAAQVQALERLEELRAARWDPNVFPVLDEVTNSPPIRRILDVPARNAQRWATNYTTITQISTVPPLKAIKIQTVWGWTNGKLFTNVITTYRGPDQ